MTNFHGSDPEFSEQHGPLRDGDSVDASPSAESVAQEWLEKQAGAAYDRYRVAVGGKTWDGKTMPTWAEFGSDPAKQVQADGWRVAAAGCFLDTSYLQWGGEPQNEFDLEVHTELFPQAAKFLERFGLEGPPLPHPVYC
jgi:hypothetical protein